MKCTAAFLVLSMVVLMAEPGECIWGALIHAGTHLLHGIIGQKKNLEEQQVEKQLEQQLERLVRRSVDYNPGRPAFD